jgi:lactate permease
MESLVAALPLVFLLVAMGHPKGMSGSTALPLAALLACALYIGLFELPVTHALSATLHGLLSALTPISIVFGAMLIFAVLRKTGHLNVLTDWIRSVSPHPVAQLMLIGWAFPFLIEGISGFGTPAALAAPLLVGLGFSPLKACFMTLIANTVPVTFGAIGTPVWFGLGGLGLSPAETLELSALTGSLQLVAALVVPVLALAQVVPLAVIARNGLFVALSVLSCAVPFWIVAQASYEFPSLIGGALGFMATLVLAQKGIGLHPMDQTTPTPQGTTPSTVPRMRAVLLATFPIWASVVLLLLTRLPGLGLRSFLTSTTPFVQADIPWIGVFGISSSLVASLEITLGGPAVLSSWNYATLYTPALVPFVVVSALFVRLKGVRQPEVFWSCGRETAHSLGRPLVALCGALVLVKLLMADHAAQPSAAALMGTGLGHLFGSTWPWFAMGLGVLGAFFSGSATVSNLTFGALQSTLGEALDAKLTVLALQASGAALGNMVCLHNIIAVTAILGLTGRDNEILRRNAVVVCVAWVVITVVTLKVLT